MRKTIPLFLAALCCVLQAACTPAAAPEGTPVASTQPLPTAAQGHEFLHGGELDRLAILAAYGEDPQAAARKLADLYVDIIQAGKSAAFERLFDRETLAATEPYPKENHEDTYECMLTGSGPMGERRVPLLLFFTPDAPQTFFCPLQLYAEACFTVTEQFLALLHDGDAGALLAWLSIDGGPGYNMEEAEALLTHYARYTLEGTWVHRFDYDADRDRFVLVVQDARGENFRVPLAYEESFVMPDISAILSGAWDTPKSDVDHAVVTLGDSAYFTRAELEAAVECVKEELRGFDDCTLQWITYDEGYADEHYDSYMEHGRGLVTGAARENVVIFSAYFEPGELSQFPLSEHGGGWRWTLLRDGKGDPWRVDDRGY